MANNPYEVLGVSSTATDDEIKQAYRSLAKKYHPDNFADDPNATEMAEKMMKEINEAYDSIMNMRRGGNAYSNTSSDFNAVAIRNLISSNRLDDALRMLDQVPVDKRNAEWYFLTGSVQYKRGWLEVAYTNFSTACRMDPNNQEYRTALNQIQYSRGGYNPYRTGGGPRTVECNSCDGCMGLLCLDTCCECMGGDCIGCC